MKPRKLLPNLFTLAAVIGLVAGCASKSYDKSAATSAALASTADAVSQTSTSVNGVLAALNNLTFKSQGDLRNQYDAFVSASKDLDTAMGKLDAKVVALQATGAAYINDWTNQLSRIQNEELHQRSTERKDAVAAKLKEVNASYLAVRDSLRPFTSDLKDIQTYLGTDLTAGGLDTVKDNVTRTKTDAIPLRDAIKQLQGDFDRLSAALSPVLPGVEQK